MTIPTVSASLNKASYAPGETMTLTVLYGDADNDSVTVTIVATDSSGNSSEPVTVVANVSDPVTVSVSDDSGRVWTKLSDSGAVAVYQCLA